MVTVAKLVLLILAISANSCATRLNNHREKQTQADLIHNNAVGTENADSIGESVIETSAKSIPIIKQNALWKENDPYVLVDKRLPQTDSSNMGDSVNADTIPSPNGYDVDSPSGLLTERRVADTRDEIDGSVQEQRMLTHTLFNAEDGYRRRMKARGRQSFFGGAVEYGRHNYYNVLDQPSKSKKGKGMRRSYYKHPKMKKSKKKSKKWRKHCRGSKKSKKKGKKCKGMKGKGKGKGHWYGKGKGKGKGKGNYRTEEPTLSEPTLSPFTESPTTSTSLPTMMMTDQPTQPVPDKTTAPTTTTDSPTSTTLSPVTTDSPTGITTGAPTDVGPGAPTRVTTGAPSGLTTGPTTTGAPSGLTAGPATPNAPTTITTPSVVPSTVSQTPNAPTISPSPSGEISAIPSASPTDNAVIAPTTRAPSSTSVVSSITPTLSGTSQPTPIALPSIVPSATSVVPSIVPSTASLGPSIVPSATSVVPSIVPSTASLGPSTGSSIGSTVPSSVPSFTSLGPAIAPSTNSFGPSTATSVASAVPSTPTILTPSTRIPSVIGAVPSRDPSAASGIPSSTIASGSPSTNGTSVPNNSGVPSQSPTDIRNLRTLNVATLVPTSAQTNSTAGVRFTIQYIISGSDPSPEQFQRAQEVTIDYVKTFIAENFASNPLTKFENFNLNGTGSAINPVEISYVADRFVFATDSTVVPTEADMAVLIESAFRLPALSTLIASLQGLDSTNQFSTTSNVTYRSLTRSTVSAKSSQPNMISTQFSVEYDFVDVTLTDDELGEIDDTTLEYVQAFLSHKFMMDFNVSVIGFRWQSSKSISSKLEFTINITVIMSEATEVSPAIEDLDQLLKQAFEKPYIQALLIELQKLPSVNSSESKLDVSPVSLGKNENSNDITSQFATRFLLVFCAACVFGIGVMLLSKRKKRREETERLQADNIYLVPVPTRYSFK